jgi:hypothetical protein
VVDDMTGKVAFVLVACGGFLGFGEQLRRAPWAALSYATGRGGYVLKGAFEEAPSPVSLGSVVDRHGWAGTRDGRGAEAGDKRLDAGSAAPPLVSDRSSYDITQD